MTNPLSIAFGALVVAGTLLAVLGAVERTERYTFVLGVLAVAAGPVLADGGLTVLLGRVLAVVGFLAILESTLPLLRQSPAST